MVVTQVTLGLTVMSILSVPLHVRAAHQEILRLPPSRFNAQPPSLPVPNGTVPFWVRYLDKDHKPSLTHGSEGPLTEDADICIIGSGITGVSAAYHLSRAVESGQWTSNTTGPLKTVILEAREFCK